VLGTKENEELVTAGHRDPHSDEQAKERTWGQCRGRGIARGIPNADFAPTFIVVEGAGRTRSPVGERTDWAPAFSSLSEGRPREPGLLEARVLHGDAPTP
jgi:hypothetical protein